MRVQEMLRAPLDGTMASQWKPMWQPGSSEVERCMEHKLTNILGFEVIDLTELYCFTELLNSNSELLFAGRVVYTRSTTSGANATPE